MKGLEDIMVMYDNTIRNHKNNIIQFVYGDNGYRSNKTDYSIFKFN